MQSAFRAASSWSKRQVSPGSCGSVQTLKVAVQRLRVGYTQCGSGSAICSCGITVVKGVRLAASFWTIRSQGGVLQTLIQNSSLNASEGARQEMV